LAKVRIGGDALKTGLPKGQHFTLWTWVLESFSSLKAGKYAKQNRNRSRIPSSFTLAFQLGLSSR
jgi:hypothetical protein